jgi:hypothetical protein
MKGRDFDQAPKDGVVASRNISSTDDTREFWEVWSEDVGRTPGPAGAVTPPGPALVSASRDEGRTTGNTRLYVNLGRKDGVTPELVAEQLSASGIPVSASAIELMNTHSYLNVERQVADRLCEGMKGRQYSGRAIVCEPARPPRRR